MTTRHSQFKGFEPEFTEGLREIFEEKIVFNRVIGVKIEHIDATWCSARIQMRPELVGHFLYNRVHGGVISASLDGLAGLAVMGAVGARHMDEPPAQRLQRFNRLGTIDLRVDYLRPAIADFFLLRAEVLRVGSRVGTTRMEFRGPDNELFSVGTGAYIVS